MKSLVSSLLSDLKCISFRSQWFFSLRITLLVVIGVLIASLYAAASEQVIYTFTGGKDGAGPTGLIAGQNGKLYGTAFIGGPEQAGTVFELSPPKQKGGVWTETTLYTFLFSQPQNGIGPAAGLVMDGAGNLYGTTWLGGPGQGCTLGCGIVFQLAPPKRPGGSWTFALLYDFGAPNDGYQPEATLTFDATGNLYGTTVAGGLGHCEGGCGTVFQLVPPKQPGGAWTETTLYNFPGTFPYNGSTLSGVTLDAKGAVYGTTWVEGGNSAGTVFRLMPPKSKTGHWKHTTLYAFNKNGVDGTWPTGNVIFDNNGNLYGVTNRGAMGNCLGVGCGTVYQLTPTPSGPWTLTTLYKFAGGNDGGYPQAGPIFDTTGNLVGTNLAGGGTNCSGEGCGTAYRLTQSGGTWTETILHSFTSGADGAGPGPLLLGVGNVLYGVAGAGAKGSGIVFDITP